MSGPLQSTLRNNLLSRLPDDDYASLSDHLKPCDLAQAEVLAEPDEALPFVTFPETGVVSIVVLGPDGQSAEAGIVGREGYVAPFVMLGTDRSPNRIEVQVPGRGFRLETARFVELAWQREALRTAMLRYAQALAVQTSFTAMSNASQPVDERLARWILMCHDRCDSDDIALTHRIMAVMLSVRRASVTVALQTLEGTGVVRSERGYVTVTARARLEEFADGSYGPAEAEYARLLGHL